MEKKTIKVSGLRQILLQYPLTAANKTGVQNVVKILNLVSLQNLLNFYSNSIDDQYILNMTPLKELCKLGTLNKWQFVQTHYCSSIVPRTGIYPCIKT